MPFDPNIHEWKSAGLISAAKIPLNYNDKSGTTALPNATDGDPSTYHDIDVRVFPNFTGDDSGGVIIKVSTTLPQLYISDVRVTFSVPSEDYLSSIGVWAVISNIRPIYGIYRGNGKGAFAVGNSLEMDNIRNSRSLSSYLVNDSSFSYNGYSPFFQAYVLKPDDPIYTVLYPFPTGAQQISSLFPSNRLYSYSTPDVLFPLQLSHFSTIIPLSLKTYSLYLLFLFRFTYNDGSAILRIHEIEVSVVKEGGRYFFAPSLDSQNASDVTPVLTDNNLNTYVSLGDWRLFGVYSYPPEDRLIYLSTRTPPVGVSVMRHVVDTETYLTTGILRYSSEVISKTTLKNATWLKIDPSELFFSVGLSTT